MNAPNELAYKSKNGKKIEVNIFADAKDLEGNLKVGKIIVEKLKLNVVIRPHIDGRLILGLKNPEYLINNKIGERKTPESKNYKKSLKKANEQECEIVVFDLSLNKDTVENAFRSIENVLKLNVHPFIREVYIISADGKEVKVYKRKKQPKK